MQVKISKEILDAAPKTKLGLIQAKVKYVDDAAELWKEIDKETERISKLPIDAIKDIPTIASTREIYRKLGKSPARYRPSAEALMRRIVQGKGLYKIGNLVDTINLASIKTGYSIGGYDFNKITGSEIELGVGGQEEYQGIGRGLLNIEFLPVLRDARGPFGSPTSDSERTKADKDTEKILWVVFNFGGHENFEHTLEQMADLLENYCLASQINIQII